MKKTFDIKLKTDSGDVKIITINNCFKTVQLIEDKHPQGVIELITSMANGKIRIVDIASIVHCGLVGNNDTRYDLAQVGELVMNTGVVEVATQLDDFLTTLVSPEVGGVSQGK